MTTTFIVVLAIVVGLTIGIKVYLQERDAQKALEQETKDADRKKNEEIVAERLAEIAKLEAQVSEAPKKEVKVEVSPVVQANVEKKTAPKKKKYYAPKKAQAKAKNKQ